MASLAYLLLLLLPQPTSAGGAPYNGSRWYHLEESKICLNRKVNYTYSVSTANISQVSRIKWEYKFKTTCNKQIMFKKGSYRYCEHVPPFN
jgi:hypothetical protein